MKGYEGVALGVAGGLNKDLPPEELDLNSYTELHNLRMKNGRYIPTQGYAEIFSPLPQPPKHALGLITAGVPSLFVAGGRQIHKNTSGTWFNVTRLSGDYSLLPGNTWNSFTLNGCVFFNNGTDVLQVLEYGDTSFKDSANLTPNLTAKVFRGFKEYAFALNLSDLSGNYPSSLRWSDPADPGLEPPSWDVTDPTTQAGQVVLADTDGEIVDAVNLRDKFIIYKTDSVYSCQFIGGIYIFSFQKIFSDRGALGTHCVSSFEGNHFVVGYEDIYVHDGLQARSVADGRVRDFFYNDLDQDNIDSVFTVVNQEDKEVWICYPNDQAINGSCNQALVWNWLTNVWTSRDIPNLSAATLAIVDPNVEDLWDTGTNDTWDLGSLHWDANNFSTANLVMVACSEEDDKFYSFDNSNTFNTVPFEFHMERTSSAPGDSNLVKNLNHYSPIVSGTGSMTVRFGSQYNLGEGVAWGAESTYNIGDYRAYSRIKGRYFSFKFSGLTEECVPVIGGSVFYFTQEGEK